MFEALTSRLFLQQIRMNHVLDGSKASAVAEPIICAFVVKTIVGIIPIAIGSD